MRDMLQAHYRRIDNGGQQDSKNISCNVACVIGSESPETRFGYLGTECHLKDRGFASPIIDEKEAAAKKKKKEELEQEVERVKKEYEDKQNKKKEKEKGKGEQKDKEKKKEDKKDNASTGKGKEKEEDDKAKSGTAEESSTQAEKEEDAPRVYSLHKTFYQARLNRARNAEITRRNKERLRNPSLFPSVPNSDL
ncbi:MAG: hypothetical protein M1839_006507 [Geoglossum umbratile]|nr:MAG: hypothetical protein M1839_006507 [Geoglossum umbratile]